MNDNDLSAYADDANDDVNDDDDDDDLLNSSAHNVAVSSREQDL